jgi:cell wall-associated NlpC family hydrolase
MQGSDPRLILATPEVAAAALEGIVPAPRYAPPTPMQATAVRTGLLKAPDPNAEQADELLFGEGFEVLETKGGFAFGRAIRDGYVGWVDEAALGDPGPPPSHRVSVPATFAFLEPSIKTPVVHRLSLNALATVEAREGRFLKLHGSGWVVAHHLTPIGVFAGDPAAVALQFLGVPYLWGGRSSDGLDCSGLVQQALYACGLGCPRDSDQQAALGAALEIAADLKGLARNDLVFWPGHVGIMLDETRLLHANAHAMCVSIEPLAEAVTRIEAAGSGAPSAFRRLQGPGPSLLHTTAKVSDP